MRTSEGTARVRCFGDEARLRWLGHVQRRDGAHRCRRMLRFELPSRMLRGRPKGRFMDALRENVKSVGEVQQGKKREDVYLDTKVLTRWICIQ